jgi:Na+-transporting NADH:ubiquinone oxidoreductase subunit F
LVNTVLFPALSIAGLAAALALIILIAERFLMDYGEVELTINDEKKLTVKGGETVLATLKERKIFVPSACGGRATCGYCKVKAISGFGEVLPTEAPLLTKEEIAENVRLSCQIKIKNDVAIEIPEELFHIKEFQAVLERVVDLTYDIKGFRFRLVEPDAIDYKPGQYIQFQAPEYDESDESVYRAYSMCGVPSDRNQIDLMVRLVPEGVCTTYMFNYLKKGDKVTFTGPFGDFYLRDTGGRVVCIAGGSGMAPIRSILRSMSKEEIAERRPIFFFGARSKRDLFLLDEWMEFEEQHPGFKFVPALSQPREEDEWEGETGRITEVVERYAGMGMNDAEGYLCGGPGLLAACVECLVKAGVDEERIFYDKF